MVVWERARGVVFIGGMDLEKEAMKGRHLCTSRRDIRIQGLRRRQS